MSMYDEFKNKQKENETVKKDWIIYTIQGTFNKAIGTTLQMMSFNETYNELKKRIDPVNEDHKKKGIIGTVGRIEIVALDDVDNLILERELDPEIVFRFIDEEIEKNKKELER